MIFDRTRNTCHSVIIILVIVSVIIHVIVAGRNLTGGGVGLILNLTGGGSGSDS